MKKQTPRVPLTHLVAFLLVGGISSADAAGLFSDDFESYDQGGLVEAGNWTTVSANGQGVLDDATAVPFGAGNQFFGLYPGFATPKTP